MAEIGTCWEVTSWVANGGWEANSWGPEVAADPVVASGKYASEHASALADLKEAGG